MFKYIKVLAIILVPLIMTLFRGHTWQIRRTVISLQGHKVVPRRDKVIYDKILIFILVKEIVLYTDNSPLEAPLNL